MPFLRFFFLLSDADDIVSDDVSLLLSSESTLDLLPAFIFFIIDFNKSCWFVVTTA